MFVYITVGWQCFKYIFFLSVYLSRVDLNRQSPVTSIQAVHLHISENINMKCYVEPAAARQDPTSSDEMQLSAFTSVRFQGTCTLFYPKGVNALMNSAAFFSETLHNDSWDTQGKFTVGPWTSHFRDSPNDIPLTFWTYWVFAEQRQFVVSDWAAGFGIAADYSLHIYQMCVIFSRLRFG